MLRLKAVQVVNGALRVGSGLENSAVIILENLEPCGDVGCVVFLDFRRDFEVGAKERRTQLGDEFFAGIALAGPATRLTVTVKMPTTSHEVQWNKIEAWLQSAGKPNEQGMKGRLREMLDQ